MMQFRLMKAWVLLAALAPVSVANAGGVSFTADAVQTAPGGAPQHGRLYVADEGMRFETPEGPRQVVQIVLPKQKLTRVLFPADKVYVEHPGAAPMPTDRASKPCPDLAGLTCEKIGSDTMGDAKAEKWRATRQGAQGAMLLWWDPARKMLLRQEYPDGRVVQMTRRGTEDYDGRTVERWETRYMVPSGQVRRTVELFDAKLGVTVQETRPDGTTRRLANIKETKASPAWFAVPDGYKKIDAPRPSGPAAPGRGSK